MLTGPQLGAAIEAARLAKKMSKKALAEQFGVKPPSVQGWINTGRIDKAKLIELISFFSGVVGAEHWGLSEKEAKLISPSSPPTQHPGSSAAEKVMEMLQRHGKGLSGEAKEKIAQAVAESLDGHQSTTSNVIRADFSRPGLVGDEISIAHYDIRGAMGNGQVPTDYPEMLRDVKVSQEQLRKLGVTYDDPNHLKMVYGWGHSMAPTIKHADPMIVNINIREFDGDGIFIFTWQGHLYVKRLQVQDSEHFEMISDNKQHKDRIIRMDETYIHAKVLLVWNAHLV
ncbi:TPA: LexA family transcriptional regulator [Pseudomonas aeruginosa]|uniref:LexA family transcriptional regulator n=1 Tax=Pseudomonas aeruginosa TaxID=287 RepID=UPI00146F7869|nr:LexA family transcriptional regulator [Pseudomonas aeruginosa]EKX3872624.1 LexA family transcriptional regulator [Pseudomonas aeruginosa]MBG5742007.1 LexA family transcriptional regulator [Pseudomonas aeruginosa]MBG5888667.1 LexA family transcriptional regulator [Pseudomonas aeruginosa]HCF1722097.1 LexA family transcriptional regulator [Pseudomonas aeruginosa]HCF4138205.1 LexA family transcriptional regulator [Pseudomonas aeruginosa]